MMIFSVDTGGSGSSASSATLPISSGQPLTGTPVALGDAPLRPASVSSPPSHDRSRTRLYDSPQAVASAPTSVASQDPDATVPYDENALDATQDYPPTTTFANGTSFEILHSVLKD